MIAGLLTVATLLGASVGPTAPQRYRIEMKAQQEVDATALGGGKQNTDIGVIGFVSVTMSDTTGGRLAHIVIDSMVYGPGMEAPPGFTDEPATAKGLFFHAYVVDGKIKGSIAPNTPHQLAGLITGGLESLFPGVRASSKMGDTWSDTVKVDKTTEDGTATKSTTMIDWKVAGGTAGAFTYEGKSNGTATSEGPTPQGNRTVSAKITGTRSLTGPAAGPITKGSFKTMQDVLVLMDGMTDPIPVAVVTEVTITALP